MALFPFEPPTLRALTRRVVDDIRTRLGTAASLVAHTAEAALAGVVAGVAHPLWRALDRAARASLWATTIDSTYLETWASIFGIYRKDPVKATGTLAISGLSGTVIPAGTVFQRAPDGVEYTTDEELTIPLLGTDVVGITCSTAGTIGNCDLNTQLDLVPTIIGAQTDAYVSLVDIANGRDQESLTSLAARFFQRLRNPPGGGKAGDYVRWAWEAGLDITRTWEYGGEPQLGYVTLRCVKDFEDSDTQELSPDEREQLREFILDRMPMGLDCVVADDIDLEPLNPTIKLDPNTAATQAAAAKALRRALSRGKIGDADGELFPLSLLNQALLDEPTILEHQIVLPLTNVPLTDKQVLILGTVTWQAF